MENRGLEIPREKRGVGSGRSSSSAFKFGKRVTGFCRWVGSSVLALFVSPGLCFVGAGKCCEGSAAT